MRVRGVPRWPRKPPAGERIRTAAPPSGLYFNLLPGKGTSGRNRRSGPRREADQSLINERQLLSSVLDTESVLIVLLDLDGRILLFNRACELLTGVTSADAVGRYFWEVSDEPEESASVQDFFARLLESDFPETHDRNWRGADGERRLLRWSLSKLQSAQGGDLLVAVGYDITELDQAERQLARRSYDLTERVKELGCLYGIKRLGERTGISLDGFLQSVVELIPPAWQFPEFAMGELLVEGRKFQTRNFSESTTCQRCPIEIDGREAGHVQVCYAAGHPGDAAAPFLEEEQRLLENIADAIGRVVINYRSRERIADYQARLRSLASELSLTGERERRRIAQQLHDDIGHNLALLKFKLGEQRSRLSGEDWEDLASLLETCIQASRTLTFELSPPVLHELGLGAALEWLSHQLEANYGIRCRCEDDRQPKPLSEDLRVEVFQTVRELLNNIGKHSEASEAWIRTEAAGDALTVIVGDNGRGFDVELQRQRRKNPGWGLFGIRERLAHLGGEFTVDSAPGHGALMTIRVPLAGEPRPPLHSGPLHAAPGESAAADPSRMIRILLADDQQLTRAGLKSMLGREGDMEVVGEAGTGTEAVRLAAELKPDVVVMDVVMPELNGIQATGCIVDADPEIKVIGLSMHADGQYVLEMLRAGATGYLLKDCAQEDLAQAIRVVQANLTFLSPGLTDSMAHGGKAPAEGGAATQQAADTAALNELTPREREVLVLLARGRTTKQIAGDLGVSVKTAETHRQHVMEKLGDNSIAHLTRFAIQHGLVELE